MLLPCSHEFHYKCVSVWIASHNECSNCRQNVFTIRYNILTDTQFDEKTLPQEDQQLSLRFAYISVGPGLFLQSVHPLELFELVNMTGQTVHVHNRLNEERHRIPARSHFPLTLPLLTHIDFLTLVTVSTKVSLRRALLRLRAGGEDVMSDHRSLSRHSLMHRLDGTSRLSTSGAEEWEAVDQEEEWASARMRRRSRDRGRRRP